MFVPNDSEYMQVQKIMWPNCLIDYPLQKTFNEKSLPGPFMPPSPPFPSDWLCPSVSSLPSVCFVQWPAEIEPCPYLWVFVCVRFPSFLSICPVLSFTVLLNLKGVISMMNDTFVCLLNWLFEYFYVTFLALYEL